MKKWLRSMMIASLAGNLWVVLMVFSPATNMLYAALEVKPQIRKADAILLLSAGNYTAEIFGQNSYQRMMQAFSLYKNGYAEKIIICGGIIDDGETSISEHMKNFLVSIGLPAEAILTEKSSLNTYENLVNAKSILSEEHISEVLLVTSSYHMFRSQMICRKIGLRALPAPVPCYEKEIAGFTTRSQFVMEIFREYGALIYFKLRGWL